MPHEGYQLLDTLNIVLGPIRQTDPLDFPETDPLVFPETFVHYNLKIGDYLGYFCTGVGHPYQNESFRSIFSTSRTAHSTNVRATNEIKQTTAYSNKVSTQWVV